MPARLDTTTITNASDRVLKVFQGVRLFAATDDADRDRRPTDATLLILSALVALATASRAEPPSSFDVSAGALISDLPTLLDPLWRIGHDLLPVWALVIVALATVRLRWRLLRDLVIAGIAGAATAPVLSRLAVGTWPDFLDALGADEGSPLFPALRIAAASAIVVTASPHLARPMRYLGRTLLSLAAVASAALEVALPGGVLAGLAVGVAVAATVHLVFGSPGGRPGPHEVATALAGLGVEIDTITPAAFQPEGVLLLDAVDTDGHELQVKVYGRDAWDGQALATAWRFLMYREAGSSITFSRLQLVEHEAFLTLLAERVGTAVQPVVVAGMTDEGDALLVTQRGGTPLGTAAIVQIDDSVLDRLWAGIASLHRAGIAHGRLDADRIVLGDNGQPGYTDFGAATVAASDVQILTDRAQLLVLTAVIVGIDRAVAAAERALGSDGLAECVPYLQPPALNRALRTALKAAEMDLDELRSEAIARSGVDEPELVQLRRVTLGSALQAVFLIFAASAIFSGLGDIGFDTIRDELSNASWQWLLVAVVVAQLPRVAQSFSTLGASPHPLRLGPVAALQFAITFVNLAVPSSAARVAMNVRFFQRLGLTVAAALSIGVLDSVAGFVVQAFILVGIPLLGLGSLGLSLEGVDFEHTTLILVLVVVLVTALIVTVTVPKLRDLVLPPLREMLGTLRVLRSPAKVGLLFGGNLASEILFAAAIGATLQAFGESATITELMLVNAAVTLVAGLLPVPGGIGVSEAGLIVGLTAIGVAQPAAVGVAIAYRMASFYLPPVWGWFAMRWLQRNAYL